MDSKYIVGVITIAVTAMLVGSVLIPVIDTSSRGGTEYEDNPDWDGWIRFDLNRSASAAYEISITQDENGIYVGAGTDVQAYDDSSTGEYATIFYADSNTVVWADDGDAYKIMGTSNGSPVYFTTSDDLTISRDSNGVSVSDGVDSYTFDTPSWAYVPKSTGTYGFYPYDAERGVSVSDAPTAVVGGGFAGVYAYNDTTRYAGLGLTAVPIVEDGMYYGATWEKVAAETPDDVQITPLDPSVIGGGDSTQPIINPIDPEPDATIMSVPTPTYTEGDWGYNLGNFEIDGVITQYAIIVSYSGTGGDIVVPATIGGHTVYCFGYQTSLDSTTTYEVFDNSALSADSTLTISEGISLIGAGACLNATNITGNLNIPKSVIEIGRYAFQNAGITSVTFETGSLDNIHSYAFSNSVLEGSIILPQGITTLGGYAFSNSPGLTDTLLIPESISSYGTKPFNQTNFTNLIILSDYAPTNSDYKITTLKEVLDLAENTDFSVTRCGIPAAATVSDSIGDSFGFIAPMSVAHGTDNPITPYKSLLYVIPVIILIVGLLIMAGFVIAKRDY